VDSRVHHAAAGRQRVCRGPCRRRHNHPAHGSARGGGGG
jgi:hypothetical protein